MSDQPETTETVDGDQHDVVAPEPHPIAPPDAAGAPVTDSEGHAPEDTPDRVEQPGPEDGVEGEPDEAPAPQPLTLQEEQYARACADPEYAAQQAISVPEEDRGPAYEYGSLADYERTSALEAQADEDSSDDDSEEV